MATNVPPPLLTPTGFIPPTQQAILLGVQADFNQAFGVVLNFGTPTNPTPQGQLAASWAAIYGNACDAFCFLANSVDPAFATGRMQDAIGRIYFLSRDPGEATVVQCQLIGLPNTVIPFGALALTDSDQLYICAGTVTIPNSGNITAAFQCSQVGPIPCPAGTLNTIYRTIPGWDNIRNATDGVLGSNVESRAAYEGRRQLTVAANTVGFNPSVLGAVLKITGVLDAYVQDNSNVYPVAYTPEAVIQGSISGTTLTVDAVVSGVIKVGQSVTGSSGTNVPVQAGTVIVSGSGTSWVVNHSQTVSDTKLQLGGVVIPPNSLYVAAIGGDINAVAKAIWSKKSPGCPYYPGNTTVTVYDDQVQYAYPGVPYTVVYEVPPALPFVMQVSLADNPGIPANAQVLIANAIIAAFGGSDIVGQRVKIGSLVLASRFYPSLIALGNWVEIVSLFISTTAQPEAEVTGSFGANFTGTGSGTNLTVASGVVGYISPLDPISGPGIPAGTVIVSQTSGTPGKDGVYVTSNATTPSAQACVTNSSILSVSAVAGGDVQVNEVVFDDNADVLDGTTISAQINGTPNGIGRYQTNLLQHVAPESMVLVLPNQTRVNVTIDQAPTITAACVQVEILE